VFEFKQAQATSLNLNSTKIIAHLKMLHSDKFQQFFSSALALKQIAFKKTERVKTYFIPPSLSEPEGQCLAGSTPLDTTA